MTTQTITARDVPEIRTEMAHWLADPGPFGGPATWSRNLDEEQAAQEERAAADWSVALRAAQLFYCSADMAHLAVSAGLALPSYQLHPEDLPAPHGLIVWETPVTETEHGGELVGAPITAASWGVHGNGVHLRLWCKREDWLTSMAEGNPETGIRDLTPQEVKAERLRYPQPIVSLFSCHLRFGRAPGWLAGAPKQTEDMSLAELQSLSRAKSRSEQAERALVVSWLLMGQALIREEEVHAPKTAAKRIGRLDPALLTSTRYVQLRHRSIHAENTGRADGTSRIYTHRWLVRGHWRNHWYPSRQAHRPIWIDGHWKGAEGAPILDPDKLVNILRR